MTYNATRRAGDLVKGENGSRQPITYIVRTGNSSLICDNANRKLRDTSGQPLCTNRAKVRYQYLEAAVLEHLLHLALDPSHFESEDAAALLATQAAEIDRQLQDKETRLGRLIDSYSRTGSTAVEEAMVSLEVEIEQVRQERTSVEDDLLRLRGNLSRDQHLERVKQAEALLRAPDCLVRLDARVKVAAALRSIIAHMECDEERSTQIWLRGSETAISISPSGQVEYDDAIPDPAEIWAFKTAATLERGAHDYR